MEATVRARIRTWDELDPKFHCCEELRVRHEKFAGKIVDVIPSLSRMEKRKCICGAVYEMTSVRLAAPVAHFSLISTDFIDIDEGGLSANLAKRHR